MMLAENVVELTIASQLEFIDLVTTLTDNVTQMIGFDDELLDQHGCPRVGCQRHRAWQQV